MTPEDIIEFICYMFGVKPSYVLSKHRTQTISDCRHVCAASLKYIFDMSLNEIANELNRRHHTTISNSLRQATCRRDLADKVDIVIRRYYGNNSKLFYDRPFKDVGYTYPKFV